MLQPACSLRGLFAGKQLEKVTFHSWASLLMEMPLRLSFSLILGLGFLVESLFSNAV